MTGNRDDEEQPGKHDEDGKHQASFREAPRAGGEDKRAEARDRVHVADDLRGENGDDLLDACSLKRREDSDGASKHGEQRESTKLRLQVVVLAAPGESRERNAGQQYDLEDRQSREDDAAGDGDDLGHANTVAVRP